MQQLGRRQSVDQGGPMVYDASLIDRWQPGAYFVDRMLKGARPADLPVEQPMLLDFVVKMPAARVTGLAFPPEIMLQVTDVIDG